MPIIKSAIKRARQASKRRSHNLQIKRAVLRDMRAVTDAVAAGDAKTTTTALSAAFSEIDRAVKKGTLHKNTAARRKSHLSKLAASQIDTKAATQGKKAAHKTAAKPGVRSSKLVAAKKSSSTRNSKPATRSSK